MEKIDQSIDTNKKKRGLFYWGSVVSSVIPIILIIATFWIPYWPIAIFFCEFVAFFIYLIFRHLFAWQSGATKKLGIRQIAMIIGLTVMFIFIGFNYLQDFPDAVAGDYVVETASFVEKDTPYSRYGRPATQYKFETEDGEVIEVDSHVMSGDLDSGYYEVSYLPHTDTLMKLVQIPMDTSKLVEGMDVPVDHLVGKDVVPGVYKLTARDPSTIGYYARYADDQGKVKPVSVINTGGSGYIEIIETDAYLKTYNYDLTPVDLQTLQPMIQPEVQNGVFLVGYDIAPGTYQVEPLEQTASIALLQDVTMGPSLILNRDSITEPTTVTVSPSVFAVELSDAKMVKVD